MKKITNSCERARALYLKQRENEKILRENHKKEFATKVFRHFKKIFPDIKYHEQRDEFELCGYFFDYGFMEISDSHIYDGWNSYESFLKNKRKPYFVLKNIDGSYIYAIKDMEDLGRFLVAQERKPLSIKLAQWARRKGII